MIAAALLASWAVVAPSEQATLARTDDGLRVAYTSGGQLFVSDPANVDTVPVTAAPDVRPALEFDGTLRVFTGGVSATSFDGVSWQAAANDATGEVSAAGDLLAWTDERGHVRVGGVDHGPGAFPALASGMVAFDTGGGVRVQPIGRDGAPAGEASAMPDSAGQGRPSIVAVRDGYVVASGSRVWRVGSASTLALDGWATALSADARGRVWATWTDDERVYAARSDRDVSEFGATVDLGALTPSRLAISAATAGAHVLAGANGVSYLKRTLPGLSLAERHRRGLFTFSVTDAGEPVRGVVVKAGRRSGKTDRNGRVTLRVANRKQAVSATLKGYEKARLRLK